MKAIEIIFVFVLMCISIWSCKEGFNNPMAEATIINESGGTIPTQTRLSNPYPNPLERSKNNYLGVTITIAVSHSKVVNLAIENLIGDVVCVLRNESTSAGMYVVMWNTKNNDRELVRAGFYIVHLTTSTGDSQKKLIEIRD